LEETEVSMTEFNGPEVGEVAAIWRYPVKSILGEELNAVDVTEYGLSGDRSLALIDRETGKVASAKNPRLWPNLFEYRASYLRPPVDTQSLPLVRIDLPTGESLTTEQTDLEDQLSASLGRAVRIAQASNEIVTSEGYWPDYDWLESPDEVFEFALPQGTFFDGMPVHILTTATLAFLKATAPRSRFDVRRFRPNFVIETPDGTHGFVEDDWIGRTLAFGEVTLRIERPCPRCVMTTLSQANLPKDPEVLRAAVQKNAGNVGAYATVVDSGQVRYGNVVKVY
jgi:uncharacterized protein YcbX